MTAVLHLIFDIVIVLITVYTIRHYTFTLNRLLGKQRHPYIDITTAEWPSVTVMVPAHNEQDVVAHSIEALLNVNYPPDKIDIIIVNDRSKDRTKEIVDDFAMRYPGRIRPFHRTEGKGGKAAALKDATEQMAMNDIIVVFDADYIPGRGLIKQLVAPFFDPEVGLVMGRVVPINADRNLLTRLLDMERAGGYQVDQQARMNLGLVPQYGGTVGGVRKAVLEDTGGWRDDTLAEDTDLTYRALLRGWKTVYQNRSECYEEVPENWPVRSRQIMRWAKGHNQALFRYAPKVLLNRKIRFAERLDALLLLGVYAMCPIILLGWIVGLILFYMGDHIVFGTILPVMMVVSYGTLGNFAAFYEVSSAVYLDGGRNRIRLLPLNLFNYVFSLISVSRATLGHLVPRRRSRRNHWEKTPRFRANHNKEV